AEDGIRVFHVTGVQTCALPISTIRDITERKKAESEIINSRKFLYSLLKNLPGVTYRCRYDDKWTMEFISEGCFLLTGYHYNQIQIGRASCREREEDSKVDTTGE